MSLHQHSTGPDPVHRDPVRRDSIHVESSAPAPGAHRAAPSGRRRRAPAAALAAALLLLPAAGAAADGRAHADEGARADDPAQPDTAQANIAQAGTAQAGGAPGAERGAPITIRVDFAGVPLELRSTEGAQVRTVEVLNGGRVVFTGELPRSGLAFATDPRMGAEVLQPRGQQPLLRAWFDATLPGDEPLRYELILQSRERRARRFELLWQARVVDREPGDRFVVHDLDRDGRDELLLVASNPAIRTCGQTFVPLYPRVFDTATRTFRAVHVRPALPAGTARLTPTRRTAHNHLPNDTRVNGVSSNAQTPLQRSYGAAPSALTDGDPETVWTSRAPGNGVGQFVTGTGSSVLPVAGVTIEHPPLPAAGASRRSGTGTPGTGTPGTGAQHSGARWLLLLDRDRSYVLEGGARERTTWLLPEPVHSSCVTLVALEAPAGADQLSLSGLVIHTTADLVERDAAWSEILLPLWRSEQNPLRREQIARLLPSEAPEVIELLRAEAASQRGERQAELVGAMMSTEAGQQASQELLREGRLEPATIAALGRRGDSAAALSEHLFELLPTATPETQAQILRVLSRTIEPERAIELLPWAQAAPPEAADQVAFALGRAGLGDAPALFAALGNGVQNDTIVLRALVRIARRHTVVPQLSEDDVARVRAAMEDDNGTVARLALHVVGWYRIEPLIPALFTMAREDRHPMMREAALVAIGALATRRPDLRDEAAAAFIAALDDGDPGVRIVAARRLSNVPLSFEQQRVAAEALAAERWPEVTRSLTLTLIRQRNDDADAAVLAWLQTASNDELRSALIAWQARGTAVPFEELALLRERTASSSATARALVRTLSRAGERANELLAAWYEDESVAPEVRGEMLESIGRTRTAATRPLLERELAHEDPAIRRAAVRGLAFHADAGVLATLETLAESEQNLAVQRAITGSIRAIRAGRALEAFLPDRDAAQDADGQQGDEGDEQGDEPAP